MITQPGKFRAPQYGKPVAARDEVRELPKKQFSQSMLEEMVRLIAAKYTEPKP